MPSGPPPGMLHPPGPGGPMGPPPGAPMPAIMPEKEPYNILSFPAGLIPKLVRNHHKCDPVLLRLLSGLGFILYPEGYPEAFIQRLGFSRRHCGNVYALPCNHPGHCVPSSMFFGCFGCALFISGCLV